MAECASKILGQEFSSSEFAVVFAVVFAGIEAVASHGSGKCARRGSQNHGGER
jgi:hypothetical protein